MHSQFQSTRPLRGATRPLAQGVRRPQMVSIHAPLAGRDRLRLPVFCSVIQFQSTRPLRGATAQLAPQFWITEQFQSTRPLRGATPTPGLYAPGGMVVSIHAPLAGRDETA